jgi:putative ABC transport system ATP-binding protein
LFELNAQQGTTLVLVTHNPALAKRCAKQATMQSGQLTMRSSEVTSVA